MEFNKIFKLKESVETVDSFLHNYDEIIEIDDQDDIDSKPGANSQVIELDDSDPSDSTQQASIIDLDDIDSNGDCKLFDTSLIDKVLSKSANSRVHELKCSHCDEIFKTIGLLNQHYFQNHEYQERMCHICFDILGNQGIYESHIATAHYFIKCDACIELFQGNDSLRLHVASHHRNLGSVDQRYKEKVNTDNDGEQKLNRVKHQINPSFPSLRELKHDTGLPSSQAHHTSNSQELIGNTSANTISGDPSWNQFCLTDNQELFKVQSVNAIQSVLMSNEIPSILPSKQSQIDQHDMAALLPIGNQGHSRGPEAQELNRTHSLKIISSVTISDQQFNPGAFEEHDANQITEVPTDTRDRFWIQSNQGFGHSVNNIDSIASCSNMSTNKGMGINFVTTISGDPENHQNQFRITGNKQVIEKQRLNNASSVLISEQIQSAIPSNQGNSRELNITIHPVAVSDQSQSIENSVAMSTPSISVNDETDPGAPINQDLMKLNHLVNSHSKNTQEFTCKDCGEVFISIINLYDHLSKKHVMQRKKCQLCNQNFHNQEMLDNHLIKQHQYVPCKICFVVFASLKCLRNHMIRLHPLKCNHCNKEYESRLLCHQHMISKHRVDTISRAPSNYSGIANIQELIRKPGVNTLHASHAIPSVPISNQGQSHNVTTITRAPSNYSGIANSHELIRMPGVNTLHASHAIPSAPTNNQGQSHNVTTIPRAASNYSAIANSQDLIRKPGVNTLHASHAIPSAPISNQGQSHNVTTLPRAPISNQAQSHNVTTISPFSNRAQTHNLTIIPPAPISNQAHSRNRRELNREPVVNAFHAINHQAQTHNVTTIPPAPINNQAHSRNRQELNREPVVNTFRSISHQAQSHNVTTMPPAPINNQAHSRNRQELNREPVVNTFRSISHQAQSHNVTTMPPAPISNQAHSRNRQELNREPVVNAFRSISHQAQAHNVTAIPPAPISNQAHSRNRQELNREPVVNAFRSISHQAQAHNVTAIPPAPISNQAHSKTLSKQQSIHCNIKFKCELCYKLFCRKRTLQAHIRSQHRIICEYCREVFESKALLTKHYSNKHSAIVIQCRYCQTLMVENELENHMIREHRVKCDEVFTMKRYLARHRLAQHTTRKCHLCNENVESEIMMHTHLVTHHNFVKCGECYLSFVNKNSLEKHMVKDHRPQQLQRINTRMLQNQHLIETHSIKEIKCTHCDLTFVSQSSMDKHAEDFHKILKEVVPPISISDDDQNNMSADSTNNSDELESPRRQSSFSDDLSKKTTQSEAGVNEKQLIQCPSISSNKPTLDNDDSHFKDCSNSHAVVSRLKVSSVSSGIMMSFSNDSTTKAVEIYENTVKKAQLYLDESAKIVSTYAPLNSQEAQNLKWALGIWVRDAERRRNGISFKDFIQQPPFKRSRPENETTEPSSKRVLSEEAFTGSGSSSYTNEVSKSLVTSSFTNPQKSIEVTADQSFKVSIVDAGSFDLRISDENFSLVQDGIQDEMFRRMCENKEKSSFAFKTEEEFRGFRIISCRTEFALSFLKEAVASLGGLWEGAILEVRQLSDLPSNSLIKVNLPVRNMDIQRAMGLLINNNVELPISSWKVIAYGDNTGGKIPLLFRVDQNSVKTLERNNFEIGFCLRSIIVKVVASNIQDEMHEKYVTVEQLQASWDETVDNFSTLFNARLELDKDSDNVVDG